MISIVFQAMLSTMYGIRVNHPNSKLVTGQTVSSKNSSFTEHQIAGFMGVRAHITQEQDR